MRLNEAILLENPRDQMAIESIAEAIMQHIEGMLRRTDDHVFSFDLSDVRGLSHLYPRLRVIDVQVWRDTPSNTLGSFNNNLKNITLYIGGQSREKIKSTIAHEIRHALDNSYSKGQYIDRSRDYMSSQHEVNARFTQAMGELNQQLHQSIRQDRPMSPTDYLSEFEKLAVKYDLIGVFADPSQSRAAEWLSKMDDKGKVEIFGMPTDVSVFIQGYTGSSRLSSAVTDKKRYQRLLSRVYASYVYNMEKYS